MLGGLKIIAVPEMVIRTQVRFPRSKKARIDEDEPAPAVNVRWPIGFSGAVDFGRMDDGRIVWVLIGWTAFWTFGVCVWIASKNLSP